LENTPEPDIFIFAALRHDTVVGCAIFSRVTYSDDARNVFILSPMAGSPQSSKQWYRTNPIAGKYRGAQKSWHRHLMTYGDPNYYGKIGFLPVKEQVAPPPFPLSMPVGWIGQSLHDPEIAPIAGILQLRFGVTHPAIW
jgi:putative acetyltransferase